MITRYLLYILAILCFTNLQGQHYKKPNVVLIIIDDLNDFPEGFYGHPQAKTPHMKALGVSSARFKQPIQTTPCAVPHERVCLRVYTHTTHLIFG